MTKEQIQLVTESFEKLAPQADQAAALFYGRLFEIDPALRSLFKGDLHKQGQKLMQMIGVAVNGLGRIEELGPALRSLGVRHTGYGVEASHYDTVGTALLWTLGKGLGPDFTPDTQEAWIETFSLLAEIMKEPAGSAPLAN